MPQPSRARGYFIFGGRVPKLIDNWKQVLKGSATTRLALGAAAIDAAQGAAQYWMNGEPPWRCAVYVTVMVAIAIARIVQQDKLHQPAA